MSEVFLLILRHGDSHVMSIWKHYGRQECNERKSGFCPSNPPKPIEWLVLNSLQAINRDFFISKTIFEILAEFILVRLCRSTMRILITVSSKVLGCSLRVLPSAPVTSRIFVILIFYNFFNSLVTSWYFSVLFCIRFITLSYCGIYALRVFCVNI